MNDDIFIINVQIGGFPITLRIPRSDEEKYRRAEKITTKLIDTFHRKYSQQAYENILKLTAYHLAVTVSENELEKDITPFADKIKSLEKELDAVLDMKQE